ncbi:interleukin-7 receptor subunit alpha [Epinephelus moara]|uniref:interleukin-7 receptor subunit alpha n=1 Tax=Epinephelus moara TaxID=300413 RepID=UPI00214E6B0B|nr:interleukin-7 receptor subunit alpha [Epinephelus moara]
MLLGCWIAAPLLLLLLLSAGTRAQSGDGDTDMEPRVSCTSDILMAGSSLTCKLVGGRSDSEDDEDEEADVIDRMTVCYFDWNGNKKEEKCLKVPGDTVTSKDLRLVLDFNVSVHLKSGRLITTMVDLKKIVKPRSPQVKNVTFDHESNQAVIRIQTPYHKDYLKLENQLFQLLIQSPDRTIPQNFSSDTLKIDMQHLRRHTVYHVKVRALPVKVWQGTWSDWSETYSFFTPAGENKQRDGRRETYTLLLCFVVLLVVPLSVIFFWKNKIFTYMWPSIPHPKHTLVQICKPNKGLLLNFKPEVFSALKVEKMEEQPCEETSIAAAAADGAHSEFPGSSHSSDSSRSTTSVSTEELELSALLSRSSSDGEDALQSTSLSPVQVQPPEERAHTPQPECSGGGNEAEAYVTMSSFYQIK